LALLLAGACSAPVDSGPRTIREASLPAALREETSSTTTTTGPGGESEEVTVYFINAEQRLGPVKRRVTSPVTVKKVLEKLFAGPTDAERLSGLHTAISGDTAVLGADVDHQIATVNVSKDFAFGPVPEQIIAFAQVVFTAVEVDGVIGVLFARNGKRLVVAQGDGSSTSVPLSRAAYPQVTPR
jgi:spore germination protein GerM